MTFRAWPTAEEDLPAALAEVLTGQLHSHQEDGWFNDYENW
jgi:hypothetical protein